MMFPKPPPRKKERLAKRRYRSEVIAAVRRQIALRDTTCRVCGKAFGVGEQTPEMHEISSRSMLRGKLPNEIFNTANCVLLHRVCHRAITERRIRISTHTSQGANGKLTTQSVVNR